MEHLLMLLLLLWSSGTSKGNVGTSEGTSMGTTQNTSALEDEFMCKSPAISDIVILLDGSSSISRINFELARTFLENLVRAFSVGYDKTRIGLVQYSGDFWIEWHLNAHTTKEGVIEAIKNLLHKGGGTKTGQALIFILDTSFKAKFGSRPGVPKILILITDGDSQDDVTSPARSLREAGIELFAIGVRDAPFSELKAIASPPEETHVYNLADFSGLSNIVESLSKTVCERVEQLDTQIKDYIRLVNGSTHCSGRLEVRSNQSNQSNQWSSVCEEDFDQQDAEVVCRELGCGALSVLQGALYGEVEAPMWPKEFQCGGHESSLLYCRSSGSERNTCSPGKAVGLTCSEPVRLVGGASRCEGTLEVEYQGEWRPVDYYRWNLKVADVACRDLDCGSAVSIRDREESSERSVWWIPSDCVQSGSAVRDCLLPRSSSSIMDLTCSKLLFQPIISVSSSMYGVSEAQQQGAQVLRGSTFTVCCSIQPQYPGGSFQLTSLSLNSAHNYTKPAVNHSANFLFPAAEPAHHGSYRCVYHLYVFSHDFSSESRLLRLSVEDPTPLIIKAVLLPLMLLWVNVALYLYCKTTRGRKLDRQEDFELDHRHLGVPAAEEEGAQGAG
uniref:Uncharacterized protein n=1 Tax=Gasterosteus aculeatus aculeatus TaxID=481459 RepID=A0AAQ4RTH8_GASAC